MSAEIEFQYKPMSDPSLWGVVFSNLISIVLAYWQNWDLGQIMWVYWGQSVVIGVMNVIRMLSLKEFSTEGMKMNEKPVPETMAAKRQVAIFFALHYGIFHAAYFMFLWQEHSLSAAEMTDALFMMIALSVFVGSHSYSFMHNFKADFRQKKPNLGTLMFYPYLRIIPMHLAIIFGGMFSGMGMIIFMGLKTFADAGTHAVEHHLFQKPDKTLLRD